MPESASRIPAQRDLATDITADLRQKANRHA